mgnify:CR=1 FL=1
MTISRAARMWHNTATRTMERYFGDNDYYEVPCSPEDQMTNTFIEGVAEELGFDPSISAINEMRRAAKKAAWELVYAYGGEVKEHFERVAASNRAWREQDRKDREYRAQCRASWAKA